MKGLIEKVKKMFRKQALRYLVTEDNGGGITMFVFRDKKCIYAATGIEYESKPTLMEAVRDLNAGCNPLEDGWVSDWEGDPDALCLEILRGIEVGGTTIIADNEGIYWDDMGANGYAAFGGVPE